MDGPQFLRLAAKLPFYEGALRKKLQMEAEEKDPEKDREYEDETMPKTMSMTEALARGKGNHTQVLHALNEDSHRAHAGALFDYSTVSG